MGIDEQRREVVERLGALELEGGSHEMLSAIARAVMPGAGAWTVGACRGLRDRLVALIGRCERAGGMTITDELREYATTDFYVGSPIQLKLRLIANHIDAEHEAEVFYWQCKCYKDGCEAGLTNMDEWLAQHEDAMAKRGWVRKNKEHESACGEAYINGVQSVALPDMTAYVKLPVDADGVPIRVGDVMEWCDSGETLTVEGIGRDVLFYIDGENAEWTAARNKRHHKPPTVEDVLREFALRVAGKECMTARHDVIAEYAAKLRLVIKSASSISACCRGERVSAYGYTWRLSGDAE